MKLESIKDTIFNEYGRVIDGYDFLETYKVLRERIPRPLDRIVYVASEPLLETLPVFEELENNFYGGMPIQAGYCSGHGTKLNALEYHRDTEINITVDDVILLLARRSEIDYSDWSIQSSKVRAFLLPAGTAVELYATTLHYAPSSVDETGFQIVVVLPRGTNSQKPDVIAKNAEDRLLFASNKWLLAHSEAKTEISGGAHAGIKGDNPDVRSLWK
jgi:hypothetical protein